MIQRLGTERTIQLAHIDIAFSIIGDGREKRITKRDLQLLHMNMKRIESEHVLVQRRKRCFVWKRNDNIDWRRAQIHVKNCGVGHKFNIKRREGEKDRVVLARFPQQRIRNISMM